jgi:hypothetical protein
VYYLSTNSASMETFEETQWGRVLVFRVDRLPIVRWDTEAASGSGSPASPHELDIQALPGCVHSVVASFLPTADVLRLMGTCRALQALYTPHVTSLVLRLDPPASQAHTRPWAETKALMRLLRRLPRARRLEVHDTASLEAVTKAIRAGVARQLEELLLGPSLREAIVPIRLLVKGMQEVGGGRVCHGPKGGEAPGGPMSVMCR